ncbi:hypothetical protein DP145_03510 [Clostridium tetani]|uniref:hypothetical protein n=1 Tax=Clostridium tetani TaxID=1513 RepID=UPI00100B68EB|nr:hypothetical protein [Clostridium tetani]RXI47286.1 hypothetical protein DP126_02605 [Clostridium tetani]RXM62310.1 hypothetical protein DP138_00790 [Clostridium tetani]RXM68881.1 hypothetical protein DP145_03510 [Clostridium tetani]
MYKKRVLYLFIIILAIIFTSCSGENEKIKYSAPTTSQVNEFISKNSLNVLSIKETSDFTIVLYQNDNSYGHYVLYKDQKNQLYSPGVKVDGNPKESKVSLGGVASGNTPFVTIIINDKDILQKAKEVKITFTDGTVVSEEILGEGTIVLNHNEINKEPLSYTELIIYDKDMIKLYEN